MVLSLFRALMPKEERFVGYFTDLSARLVEASDVLAALMSAPPENLAARSMELSAIESAADAVTRETILALHRSFITPFDRSDIHALINALDDAVDLMDEVAQHVQLYKITAFDSHMREFAAANQKSARLLAEIMPMLADVARNAERVTGLCDQVGQVESQTDRVLVNALSDLIAEAPDVITFLGRKEVYELLEKVTDRCASVADIIESIVLDHV